MVGFCCLTRAVVAQSLFTCHQEADLKFPTPNLNFYEREYLIILRKRHVAQRVNIKRKHEARLHPKNKWPWAHVTWQPKPTVPVP